MSKNYFISDIHLGVSSTVGRNPQEVYLLDFLENIKKDAARLFIVGDLFEFWQEYPSVIPKAGIAVFLKLKELKEKGIKIYFLPGNHDFGLGEFLRKEFNFFVAQSYFDLRIDGKRVYIAHGDFIDRTILNKVTRGFMKGKLSRMFYSLIHPEIGLKMASYLADFSRRISRNLGLEGLFYDYAKNKILNEKYDIVILGHIHSPTLKPVGKGFYLNTGDWLKSFTYGLLEDGKISLREWR